MTSAPRQEKETDFFKNEKERKMLKTKIKPFSLHYLKHLNRGSLSQGTPPASRAYLKK